MQKILNWRDACHALSISRPTLNKLTNEGALKRVQISLGRVGWPASEIQLFIETRLTEAEMPSDNGSSRHQVTICPMLIYSSSVGFAAIAIQTRFNV